MKMEFIKRFDKRRDWIRSRIIRLLVEKDKMDIEYEDIVRIVIEALHDKNNVNPDPNNISVIDDGDCQGTLLFVIPEEAYQPSDYWYVKISYGSCNVCDTLMRIFESSDYDEIINDLFTLALHIVQNLRKMDDDNVV